MVFQEQPNEPWGRFDFLLIEAYQMLQDELCPKCGHPIWLCRSSSNKVDFSVEEAYCAAERTLMEYENNQRSPSDRIKDRKEKASWGRFYYTVPKPAYGADSELPGRREYYEELTPTVE